MASEAQREATEGLDSVELELREALSPDRSADASSVGGEADFAREDFELEEEIAEGGMGTVYRGVHRHTGQPVAIKLVERVANAEELERFHREIQAHAGLTHPGIVYLFEYGAIEASGPADLGSETREHPYVVMEFATHGSLRSLMPVDDWRTSRRILLEILDALAFAHARGVIHRDLKPGNLLLFGRRDEPSRLRVKLTDFGIAHAFERESARSPEGLAQSIGTPNYMAPEQIRGHWRRYGPWTDLYAVGCLAWELVCGRRPFAADRSVDVLRNHVSADRPGLDPLYEVPEGLERWVRRLIAVRPESRFRRAADAAAALPQSAEPGTGGKTETPEESGEAPTGTAQTIPEPSTPTLALTHGGAREATGSEPAELPAGEEVSRGEAPGLEQTTDSEVVPEDWRRGPSEPLPAPLVGAGLGLFGLREPPFVDRDAERDRIWEALRRAARPSCELVFLAGRAGSGKSRLAEWIARRAHELGAARVLRAVHTPGGGGRTEGLAGMIRRALHAWNISRRELYDHLRERLPSLPEEEFRETDVRALTEFLEPTPDGATDVEGPVYQFSSIGQKRALLVRVLRRFASERPVVVWLDDLQWGVEALGLLERLRDQNHDTLPALVLSTLRSDVLAESPRITERIRALESGESSTRIAVEPLEPDDQRELLEGLLPLEEELSRTLADRTEGHPLFAMQLLGHWIESDELEIGARGFQLPEGAEVELPADIHELWTERVERLLDGYASGERRRVLEALELAAALGREVDGEEWATVLAGADLESPPRLVDRLIERGLARRTDEGWAFAHGLLVESLARRAREEGRWASHHRSCARALEPALESERLGPRERIAEHWVEAGELERAAELLLTEIRMWRERRDERELEQLVARRGELLEELDLEEDDRRRLEQRLERARILEDRIGMGRARETLRKIWSKIGSEDHRLRSRAACFLANAALELGEPDRARERAEEAVEASERTGDLRCRCRSHRRLSAILCFQAEFDRAEEHADRAAQLADELGDRWLRLSALRLRAQIWKSKGVDGARDLIARIRREAAEAGYVGTEARTLMGLGDMERYAGDLDRARSHYRRSLSKFRELSPLKPQGTGYINLAQTELKAGNVAEALEHLESARAILEQADAEERIAAQKRVIRLAGAAHREDRAEFESIWETLRDGWPERWRLIRDHPWLLEVVAAYALEAAWNRLASEVLELARELWQRLDNDRAVRHLEQWIAELDGE